MAQPTIRYRITSEVAGIDVGDHRYRANRSSHLPVAGVEGHGREASGPWTLWHDGGPGGSHTVGHADAYAALEHAVEAAVAHHLDCHR